MKQNTHIEQFTSYVDIHLESALMDVEVFRHEYPNVRPSFKIFSSSEDPQRKLYRMEARVYVLDLMNEYLRLEYTLPQIRTEVEKHIKEYDELNTSLSDQYRRDWFSDIYEAIGYIFNNGN
jgi:uncharacterized protein YeeX (DUF496 family)